MKSFWRLDTLRRSVTIMKAVLKTHHITGPNKMHTNLYKIPGQDSTNKVAFNIPFTETTIAPRTITKADKVSV